MPALTLAEATPLLRAAHGEGRLIPFLGAGFSKPLGLPLWPELMGWMGQALGFEPALFDLHGSSQQQAAYFDLEHHGKLPWFIDKMRAAFHNPAIDAARRGSIQHQALARHNFRTIYTTNYEQHIERALIDVGKDAITLARLCDFALPFRPGVCQVIKFHGDLDYPETMVLTESHYFDRFRLEAAPDQKLRADILGNVFLFIGYSFSDPNIRYIWYRLNRLRQEAVTALSSPAPRCYWTTFGSGPVQPRLLQEWQIDVIDLDPADPQQSIAELLDAL